jgi:hypothetical protein
MALKIIAFSIRQRINCLPHRAGKRSLSTLFRVNNSFNGQRRWEMSNKWGCGNGG